MRLQGAGEVLLGSALVILYLAAVEGAAFSEYEDVMGRYKRSTCGDPAIEDCETCKNPPLECLSCKTKEVLSLDRQSCLSCPANCLVCEDKGSQVVQCKVCVSGFRLNTLKECEACDPYCTKCDTAGKDKCDKTSDGKSNYCKEGSRYEGATCKPCATYCKKCDVRIAGQCDDNQCTTGYGLDATSFTCGSCSAYCKSCKTSGKCDAGQCKEGAMFDSVNKVCLKCDNHCTKCDTTGAGYCDKGSCVNGYATDTQPTVTGGGRCQGCGAHCTGGCTIPDKCDGVCATGYTIVTASDQSKTCEACDSNCNKCDANGVSKCDDGHCKPGYGYNAVTKLCVGCPYHCAACKIASDGTATCTTCNARYQSKGKNTCDFCPDNCLTCERTSGVIKCKSTGCKSGFAFLSTSGTCHACPQNCQTCIAQSDGSTKCSVCDAGYIDRSSVGTCHKCPDNCVQCKDGGTSTLCYYNKCNAGSTFKAQDGTCPKCPENCAECYVNKDGNVLCSECNAEYTLSTSKALCKKCPNNCMKCVVSATDNPECLDQQCATRYALRRPNLDCVGCPTGCGSCYYDTGSSQTVCNTGGCLATYVQSANKGCHSCNNCKKCAYSESNTRSECSECDTGYVKNSAFACVACPTGCNTCTISSSGATTCTSVSGSCMSQGYVQVVTKSCVACPVGCQACTMSGTSILCDASNGCMTGYVYESGRCLRCPSKCNVCAYDPIKAKTNCQSNQCQSGYTRDSTTGLCEACAQNCHTCNVVGKGKCDTSGCASGFVRKSDGSGCEGCATNCKQCNTAGAGKCDTSQCNAGYTRISTQTCAGCETTTSCKNCDTSGSGKCDVCNKGYVVKTDKSGCSKCPDNCEYCEFEGSSVRCKFGSCSQGYFMKKDAARTCMPCPGGCSHCVLDQATEAVGICISGYCMQGYTQKSATDPTCVKCPDGCQTCVYTGSTTSCDYNGCKEGYTQHATTKVCSACTSNCLKCDTNGAGKCDTGMCKSGYGISINSNANTITCVLCSLSGSRCSTCTVKGYGKCDSGQYCDQGYGIKADFTCISCSATNCHKCNSIDNTKCDSDGCDANFVYVSGGTCSACQTAIGGTANLDCTKCSTPGQCVATGCPFTTVLSGSTCSLCAANCKTCKTPLQCETTGCASSYIYNPSHTSNTGADWCLLQSTSCHQNCQPGECDFAGQCRKGKCKAKFGYQESDKTCVACDAKCLTNSDGCQLSYSGATNCDVGACDSSYFRDSETQNCYAVCTISTCLQCLTSDASKCDGSRNCKDAHKYDGAGTCTACTKSNCLNCDKTGAAKCDICKPAFFHVSTGDCTACLSNCKNCDKTGANTNCEICNDGYKLATNLQGCDACKSDCQNCDGSTATTHCDVCNDLFGLSIDKTTCTTCGTQCAVCTDVSGTITCHGCNTGYRLNAGTCEACTTVGCHACPNAKADCVICKPGLTLVSATSCLACSENCENCDVSGIGSCDTCKVGYFRKTVTGENRHICEPCSINCRECSTKDKCASLKCEKGFTYESGSTPNCQPCAHNCDTCDSVGSGTCDTNGCAAGFYYLSSETNLPTICKPCFRNCKECSSDGTTCTTCQDGFYAPATVTGGHACLPCGKWCKTCTRSSSTVTCTACNVGFVVVSSPTDYRHTCVPCAAECLSCTTNGIGKCDPDSTSVKGCKDKFIWDSTTKTCTGVCLSGCASCRRSDQCISCAADKVPQKDLSGIITACKTRGCHTKCTTGECDEYLKCRAGKCVNNYGFQPSDQTCQQCSTGCKFCDEATKTQTGKCDPTGCEYGWSYDAVTTNCKRIFCHGANLGQVVSEINNDCVACPAGCLSCSKNENGQMFCKKDACKRGYTWKTNANGGQCDLCPSTGNCDSCYEDSSSTTCMDSGCKRWHGRKSADGTCSACPVGCDECEEVSGSIVCEDNKCKSNYQQVAALTCVSCHSGCSSCKYSTTNNVISCNQCNSGYTVLDDESCYSCPQFCLECAYKATEASSTCLTKKCKPRYVQLTDMSCTTCPNNCGQCSLDATNNPICDVEQCDTQFAQNPDTKACISCPNGCATCKYDTTATSQTRCLKGGCQSTHLQRTSDLACILCGVSNCQWCSFNSAGSAAYCLDQQCASGYGIQTAKTCMGCGTGCSECDIATDNTATCRTCKSKYVLRSGACIACPDNCKTCTYSTGISKTICDISSCETGYAQNSQSTRKDCAACPSKCSACTYNSALSTTECDADKCDAKYALTSTKKCEACSGNCVSCTVNGVGKCDTCDSGYTLDATSKTCMQCDSRCSLCNSKGKGMCDGAQYCDAKYGLNSATSKCEACDPNCAVCRSAGPKMCDAASYCPSTGFAYDADNKVCVACPPNCPSCTYVKANMRTECTTDGCAATYGLKAADKTCAACPKLCNKCTDDSQGNMVCKECINEFLVNLAECGSCPKYCAKCSVVNSEMHCTECQAGYTLNDKDTKFCDKCPNGCTKCKYRSGKLECDECVHPTTYAYDTNKQCKLCSALTFANCIQCTDETSATKSVCQKCTSGHTLKDDKSSCLSCSTGLTNCQTSCVDDKYACEKCDDKRTATYSERSCGLKCYECTGDNCDKNTNDGSVICDQSMGLSCWMFYTVEGTVETYRRGCGMNATCTADMMTNGLCKSAGNKKECTKCCTDENCNSGLYNGLSGKAAAISVTFWTIALSVLGSLWLRPSSM